METQENLSASEMIEKGIQFYKGDGVKRKFATAARYFSQASKTDPNGVFWYAKCKFYGNGEKYDPFLAYSLFTKAADQGVIGAKYYKALCLLDGIGVDIDEKSAFEIFKDLYHNDSFLPALHQIALCHYYGRGTPYDYNEAFQTFKLATESDYFLSELYYVSLIQGPEKKEATKKLKANSEKATKVDSAAQFEYGKYLKYINRSQAIKLIKLAAANHNRDAQCYLAKMYFNVEKWNIEINYEKALKQFKKAANHGSYEAMLYCGIFKLFYKDYEKTDKKGAAKLIKDAADHRIPDAIFQYGNLLFNGTGVEKDTKAAIEHYKKAMELGNMLALLRYCHYLVEGKYIEKDIKEAERNLVYAANQGCMQAALDYVNLLKSGEIPGVTPEIIQQYYAKGGAIVDLSIQPNTTELDTESTNPISDIDKIIVGMNILFH